MATSISINSLRDDNNGVNDFINGSVSSSTLTNNLVRASTLKRILNDVRIGTLLQDDSIPLSKISGNIDVSLIQTQSLSGAIGKNLNPPKNGQLAWYTITPENLAYNAITWTSSKRLGVNVTTPEDTFHIAGGIRLSDWSTIRTTDGNGRVTWYGNANTISGIPGVYLNSENASRITQSLGDIIFYRSADATPVAGQNVSWSETFRVNSSGNISLNGTLTCGTLQSDTLDIDGQGSIVYDSSNSAIGFNKSTTRVIDLFTTKALFYKENMTINNQANRIVSNSYGVFNRITSESNITYYKLSSTTASGGQGNAQNDILSVSLGNSRIGIAGDPDTTNFSAALKVNGNELVTGQLQIDGSSEMKSNLKVGGSSELVGSLKVSGKTEILGEITISQTPELASHAVNKQYVDSKLGSITTSVYDITTTSYDVASRDISNILAVKTNGTTETVIRLPGGFQKGSTVSIVRLGSSSVRLAAGTGGTIVNVDSTFTLFGLYSLATATVVDNNTWLIAGDLR